MDTSITGATRQGGSDVIEKAASIILDEYWVQEHNSAVQAFDVIIIDVEGFEINVLMGAKKTLVNTRDLVMMIECTENIEEIKALLGEIGFDFLCMG